MLVSAPWLNKQQPSSRWPAMKRVIDGNAYNTETASLVHEYVEDYDAHPRHQFGPEYPYVQQMFRTRYGKFFKVLRNEVYLNPATEEIDLRSRIEPLEAEQAMKWMEQHCNDKIETYFEVPEAADSSTTLTLRISKLLKIRVNAAAVSEGISMSIWCERALEDALKKAPDPSSPACLTEALDRPSGGCIVNP